MRGLGVAAGVTSRRCSVFAMREDTLNRVSALEKRLEEIRNSAVQQQQQQQQASEVPSSAHCPACGNEYMEDSIFCRACGRKRDGAEEDAGLADSHCPCGAEYLEVKEPT